MGLEDREYLRDEARRYGGGGGFFAGGSSAPSDGRKRMVTILVIICVALYVVDAFTPPIPLAVPGENGEGAKKKIVSNTLFEYMALDARDVFSAELLSAPWNVYQLLTHGFAHASMTTERSIFHIFGNMLVLWMLGRVVEDRYGRYEFLYFFLFAVVFSGAAWGLLHMTGGGKVVGASGGVTAVVVLFAFTFPDSRVRLFGVWEIPGWLVGVLVVGQDFLFALMRTEDRVAYEAHLAGAAFGAAYFYLKFRFDRFLPTTFWGKIFGKRKPKLRVHDPDGEEYEVEEEVVDKNYERDEKLADEILEKLHKEGEASLTRKERKILERFSKRVRKKNNQ